MDKHTKNNFRLLVADKIFFVSAMTFISINAVIPYFLDTLGASTFQVSLASVVIVLGALISQPIFVNWASGIQYKGKTFYRILTLQRLLFLLFVITVPIFSQTKPQLMIVIFLIFWGVFNFFTGSYLPFFFGIFSKIIKSEMHWKLQGFGGATANIIALGASSLTGILLGRITFPYNYTVIFGLGTILLLLDAQVFNLIVETPDNVTVGRKSYLSYIKTIPTVFKSDKIFLKIVTGNSLLSIVSITSVYFSLYSIRVFSAGAKEIAIFTAITVIVNTVGSVFFGFILNRYSHKAVLKTAALFGFAGGIAALATYNLLWVYISFTMAILCICGYQMSCNIFIMLNTPHDMIPEHTGINNMATLVVSSVVMIISSFIIEIFSFKAIFCLIGLASFGAFMIFYSIRETRLAAKDEHID